MNRLLTILLIFIPVILYAQPKRGTALDSALSELSSARYRARQDTATVLLLNRIARGYVTVYADSASFFANKGLKLAEQLGYLHGKVVCLLTLGSSFLANNFNVALEYNFKALKIAEETNNKLDIGTALSGIGGCYYNMSKYKEARDYFIKSNSYLEPISGQELAVANNINTIGGCYVVMGDIPTGVVYQKKALQYYEQVGNMSQAAMVYGNLGTNYSFSGKYNEGLVYAFKALRLYQSIGPLTNNGGIFNCIGDIYLSIGTDTGYTVRPDSLVPATKKANLERAVSYLTQSLNAFRQKKDVPLYALSDLAYAHKFNGDYKEAMELMEAYTKRKDSILSNDINVKIARQETKREAELKELAITRKRNEQRFYIAGSLMLLVLVVVVFRNYRKQKKFNRQLAVEKAKSDDLVRQQEILMQEQKNLLEQKDMLMKEIHHRVKNNLQVISTLLDLQLDNIKDAHAQKAITEGMSRIRSISLIHQQLYQDEHMTSIEFSKFAKDLLHQVTSVFKKPGQNVALQNEIPELFLDIDTAVPLGLILNELMTNSYKYAFAGDKDGSIQIKLENTGEYYKLIYGDSGPGLPDNYNIGTGGTLGVMVVDSLSKQLGGYFEYDRTNKKFAIIFKDLIERKKVA